MTRDSNFRIATICRGAERFVHGGIFVAQGAGDQARDGVHDERGAQFAAGKHEIADREFVRGEVFGHAFVHSFVAAAQQDDPVELRKSARRVLAK